MNWTVQILPQARSALERLDPKTARRIARFLLERVPGLENPRSIGEALHGPHLAGLWKYRVGDYRLICKIEDDRLLVLVLRIGHRREVYL